MSFTIPSHINEFDRQQAAEFYRSLGMAVHPCHGPREGSAKERGKKPRFSGWTQWTVENLTDPILQTYFGAESPQLSNLGCRIIPPLIAVDLDAKADAGVSVREWLETQPHLAQVPRERSGNGAHLWFICRDLPEFQNRNGKPYDKPLVSQLTPMVTAELYFTGNLILSPSEHASGFIYQWEVTGEIPEASWAQLCAWFGFAAPGTAEPREPGRPKKEKPWWSKFSGDLFTLDLVGVFQELGWYGELLDADERKHSARCPWCTDHADGGKDWNARQTDTVIYETREGNFPGFKCLHAHCSERGLEQVLQACEEKRAGIVDRFCQTARCWKQGQRSGDGVRPRVVLPGIGRPDSVFAHEMGQLIRTKQSWFSFSDNVVIVREANDPDDPIKGLVLHVIKPVEIITEAERHAEFGLLTKDNAGDAVFSPHSMAESTSRILLAAYQLRIQLPTIRRVLDVPLPVIHNGNLAYPSPGYDPRFKTYLAPDAPTLQWMSLDEARSLILDEVLGTEAEGGFCWKDEQARCHALARLITPFCRGLMGWARTPLWIFEANRERCGKDYLAQVTFLLYSGRKVIFPPPAKDAEDEVRKRITTALMAGARFVHFSNLKGHVRFPSLEAATDNIGTWQDRILGGNTEVYLPNEAEYSFSANAGTTWEADIEGRARRIALHYLPDQINDRRFRHPDLHDYVLSHRSELLSAIAALVSEWDRQGRPEGPSAFASFPQWARIVGGIMQVCGWGDPCQPHSDTSMITGDQNTEHMRRLYALALEEFGDAYIKKKLLYELIQKQEENGLFDWIDVGSRSGQVFLGKLLNRYENRELDGIILNIPPTGKNNVQYRFSKVRKGDQQGIEGKKGTSVLSTYREENPSLFKEEGENNNAYSKERKSVPSCPSIPPALISSRNELDGIAERIAISESPVALDIETYRESGKGALNPFAPGAEIRILSLCLSSGESWLIDLRAIGYNFGPLQPVIETAQVIGHNLKFDLLWLRVKCGLTVPNTRCTMTASRLLTTGSKEPNDLGAALQRHLDLKLPKDQGRSDWGAMLLTPDQLTYAASDTAYLHALHGKLKSAITTAKLDQTLDLETRLLPVVIEMEATGFPIDAAVLRACAHQANVRCLEIEPAVRKLLKAPQLNLSSPQQIQEAFRQAGLDLPDTGVETLSTLDHEAARLLLDYRAEEKVTQQATSLLEAVIADGCIHARFEQTGTDTGRFSSREPNLQNVGRGELRNAFVAGPGRKLIIADYSQIELRAAAAISGDTAMLEAYRNGEDLHRKTAALVLGKPETEISKEDRQLAKAVNFGLIYGQSAPGLVRYAKTNYGVTMTEEEAAKFRERFFVAYRGIHSWHKTAWRVASEIGGLEFCEVRTRLGRRRLLPRGGDDWNRFTGLVNTSVQGTCADGLKLAMVNFFQQKPANVHLHATVHDELVLSAPAEQAEDVCRLAVEIMRSAMATLLPEVPVEVEAKVCDRWGEK